jgi:hypothetical protein
MSEEVDYNEVPPEDLAYTDQEVTEQAAELAKSIAHNIPDNVNILQAEVFMRNAERVYRKSAEIIRAMINAKNTGARH